jgi:hypothetical protein
MKPPEKEALHRNGRTVAAGATGVDAASGEDIPIRNRRKEKLRILRRIPHSRGIDPSAQKGTERSGRHAGVEGENGNFPPPLPRSRPMPAPHPKPEENHPGGMTAGRGDRDAIVDATAIGRETPVQATPSSPGVRIVRGQNDPSPEIPTVRKLRIVNEPSRRVAGEPRSALKEERASPPKERRKGKAVRLRSGVAACNDMEREGPIAASRKERRKAPLLHRKKDRREAGTRGRHPRPRVLKIRGQGVNERRTRAHPAKRTVEGDAIHGIGAADVEGDGVEEVVAVAMPRLPAARSMRSFRPSRPNAPAR